MFRQRTSARKPGDDLLADFRQQFPEVSTATTESVPPIIAQATAAVENPILVPSNAERLLGGNDAFRDLDPTPRASNDPWRFTPSLLDPAAFSFNAFSQNAGPGYYTPTPGGTGTLLPPSVNELHPGAIAMTTTGLETPLSLAAAAEVIQPSIEVPEITGFRPMEGNQLHHFDPFVQLPPHTQPAAVPFVPSSFVQHDTGYETMEQDNSPMESDPSEERMSAIAAAMHHPQQAMSLQTSHPLPPSAEKFRFHSTLNAPTAMVKHVDEIPVTYLNKGQAYSLTVVDTGVTLPLAPGTKYRTFVRISFEDEQQRQKPSVCWSLWKEGRGTNEAHQRGGKLQAVEYVEANQPAEGHDKRTRVELESSSFDGFSVIWTPGANGTAEVSVAVRFNFLSTDFSHSKGVKGIPVRLCAKTTLFGPEAPNLPPDSAPEICFCKVKLFRDHGAERKLSNDVAHVKKSMEKVRQQIAQVETGMKDFKRKRPGGINKAGDAQRITKVQKHKRTWSMSSASSAGGVPRMTLEEDLQFKLKALSDMFTSTRPVSILYLRGDDQDDPDLYPVSLLGEPLSAKVELLRDGPNWQARSAHSSVAGSLVSPSPSSLSLASQASAMGSGPPWQAYESGIANDAARKRLEQPSAVSKTEDDGTLSGWIEALGVDPSYRPPPDRSPKPVACFYMLYQGRVEPGKREYHRAIYLYQRTVRELHARIAAKWGLESSKITRTIHMTKAGLEIEVDDDLVQEIREGQDMQLEIEEVIEQSSAKRDWEMAIDDADERESPATATTGLILRLHF